MRGVRTLGACAITFATPCHWMVDKFTVTSSWSEQNTLLLRILPRLECGKSTYVKQSKGFVSGFFQNNRMGSDWIYYHFANYILQVATWVNWVKWKIVSIKDLNWFTLVALTQVMPWLTLSLRIFCTRVKGTMNHETTCKVFLMWKAVVKLDKQNRNLVSRTPMDRWRKRVFAV